MEKAVQFLWQVVYIVFFVSIFIYFYKSKRTYSFVRGVFLIACIFEVIANLFNLLTYVLRIRALENLFGWDKSLSFIRNYFGMAGFFLLVLGITLLIGREFGNGDEGKEEEIKYPDLQGQRRHIGISLLLFVVTLGIYFPFWLYRTVKDLKNNFDTEIPYSPGKAVGFLFIPIFNIYWWLYILFSLPLKIKHIEETYYKRNIRFYLHPVLIPILLILFSVMSNLAVSSYEREINIAGVLFFETAIFMLWLTIQAKLNAFFDFQQRADSPLK